MTNERKIGMHRLNPTHKVGNEVFMGFFPPNLDYYNDLLQDEGFKLFLMSEGTTNNDRTELQVIIKMENCRNRWTKANVIIKDTSNFCG
jgi:hypothetical protein